MTNTLLIVLSVLILVAICLQVVLAMRAKKDTTDEKGLSLILQQLNEMSRTVDAKLGENAKAMHDSLHSQLSESTRIVKEVTEGLTKLDETNKQVVSFADQLQNLQTILQNPKQRGILGEYYLETVLQNVLPPGSFQMQYMFANGEIVDAAVFVKDKIICVDSKFSLENYNRLLETRDPVERARLNKALENDLKLRIKETSKYIRPEERTMEFSFMFIPSEGIYYDLLSNTVGEENLIQRAASQYRVLIVSPTTFLAYLQTVLQGLKGMEIEERAKDIITRVQELGKHLKSYEEYYTKLGVSLGTVFNHYENAGKEFKKIDKDVTRITGQTPGLATLSLEKPRMEE